MAVCCLVLQLSASCSIQTASFGMSSESETTMPLSCLGSSSSWQSCLLVCSSVRLTWRLIHDLSRGTFTGLAPRRTSLRYSPSCAGSTRPCIIAFSSCRQMWDCLQCCCSSCTPQALGPVCPCHPSSTTNEGASCCPYQSSLDGSA